MCVSAASSAGGTRQEWAGRPDRRPVVGTSVHHGIVRHQQVGSAGSRRAEETLIVMQEVLEDQSSQIRNL